MEQLTEKKVLKKQSYTIETIYYEDGTSQMHRHNDGYYFIELLGVLEYARHDMVEKFKEGCKPDIVTRTATK